MPRSPINIRKKFFCGECNMESKKLTISFKSMGKKGEVYPKFYPP